MTLDSKRAEAMEDDMMGVGSTLDKHEVAENDEDVQAPLIRALKSWPSKVASAIPDTPPLCLKVERRGGSRMVFIAIDPGALIWAAGEVRP
jgi:hypothetical protein